MRSENNLQAFVQGEEDRFSQNSVVKAVKKVVALGTVSNLHCNGGAQEIAPNFV